MCCLALAPAHAAEAAAFKRVPLGKAVLSLPADWTSLGGEVPVWIHLHGAIDVVEREFDAIGAPGVLVTLTLPGLSKVYAEHFAPTEVFEALLREVQTALRTRSKEHEWTVGRVVVSSFSAGFGGVRELLKQPEAFARIGGLVMADSIYCGYVDGRRVDPELMAGFLKFARAAVDGKKRMVVSHSAQVPEGYASTTDTADYLLREIGGSRSTVEEPTPWRGGLMPTSEFSRGSLEVLGFAGTDAEAHMLHLRVIGVLLERAAPLVPKPARSVAELQGQIGKHIGQARFAGALWGVKIASVATGKVLFETHADRLLSPASNSKLYTGALALDRLGGDYRIVTPIFATAKPGAEGTLRGDVIVSGRGDPSWNSGSARKKFDEVIEPFAATIAGAGVKRVTGDLVADATFFRGGPSGAGWSTGDLNDYYGAEISAISLEDNYVDMRITPGAKEGDPAQIAFVQPHSGLTLDNRVVTTAAGRTRRIVVRRLIGESVVHLFGEMPLNAAPAIEEATVPRPAQWFAAALKAALEKRGIVVEGKARSVYWPDAQAEGSVKLGDLLSPQMSELVAGFMKPSQNLQTDLIFGYIGEKGRPDDAPMWRTSEDLGVAALRDFLRENNLHADDVRFDEGSGLSRNNLTSARALVALLSFMAKHREAEAFRASLPIAGVDGTLRRRMKATPAEGNLRAKTGTLRWANSISGYVMTAAGEELVFSVMLNRAVMPAGRSAREDIDAIGEMLARFSGKSE